MDSIFVNLISVVVIVLPFILLIADCIFMGLKKERPIFEAISFFLGSIYMMMAYFVWDLPGYQWGLNYYGTANVHEPFNTKYTWSLLIFAVWGFVSYFVLKFGRKKLPPLVEVFLLGGVYIGCGICLVWIFQLLCGGHPQGAEAGTLWENSLEIKMYMGPFDYIEIFCLCIVPFWFILHSAQLLHSLVKEKAEKQQTLQYKNPMMQQINQWFLKGANLFWVAAIAMLPILGILAIILCLFGQQPDGIILGFTQTSDWILSQQIAPPPVAEDTHYLCTVSLRGHRKLVRPIRYGIRRGEKIVVNRQLCVANAFEQLIMEKTPRFHKRVRHFYDTYGYPVSRHINSAWSADITYIIMKPLEWIFLIVLYFFDEKPENRIASQYLPYGWQEQVKKSEYDFRRHIDVNGNGM